MFYFSLSIVLAFLLLIAGIILFKTFRETDELEERLADHSSSIARYREAMNLLMALTSMKDSEGSPVQPTYEEYRDTVNDVLGFFR